jgi:hypothetical protein
MDGLLNDKRLQIKADIDLLAKVPEIARKFFGD